MAKQAEEQNIKSRARRRLIGAVFFALVVVVVLPMVLDSEPRITGKDIELRIPAPDGAFEPVLPPPEQLPVAAASGKITIADVTQQPESAVKPAEVVEAKPAEMIKPEISKAEVKPPEVKKADTKPQEAKKAEPVEVKSASSGGYIVQVGAFSSAATAAQEADKIRAWGFKVYTEVIAGTSRVRIGPYTDRSRAEEVRLRLEKHGEHPVVTAVK